MRVRATHPEVITVVIRWDEKAGLRRDAVRSQVIDALKAQEMKETGNENERLGQQRAWALKKGSWQSDLGKIHLGRYEPKGSNQIPTLC
jgi:hypothetical protein